MHLDTVTGLLCHVHGIMILPMLMLSFIRSRGETDSGN